MLTEVCAELHNYFCQDSDKHFGEFKISGGRIAPLDFLQNGQYFRIVGSALNDGVYQYPAEILIDEDFKGSVWAMRIPPSLVVLTKEIEIYNAEDKPTGYTSESFGGYSYSKATAKNGSPMRWQDVFKSVLNPYRKVRI